jgi:hypothetical protein
MEVSRKGFLAGSVAAVAAGSATSLAPAGAAPASVTGMTFTTLRDGNVDHLGIRTPHGIVDVSRAANAMGISNAPHTVEDVVCGRGNVAALHRIAAHAPAGSIRSESYGVPPSSSPCARATSSFLDPRLPEGQTGLAQSRRSRDDQNFEAGRAKLYPRLM